jgi:hypothetical protein
MRDPFFRIPEEQRRRLEADASVQAAGARVDRLRFFAAILALMLIAGVFLVWRFG